MLASGWVAVDLHVHTVASACAEIEMIPPLIVEQAEALGLKMMGITDHHSVENVEAVQQAAIPVEIRVLPGLEVQTREEVHVLCLYDDLDRACDCQEMILEHLPKLENREELFGAQYVVDSTGKHIRTDHRLLQTSVNLSFEEVLAAVERIGGLAIPAHVDRARYSLFANLGLIPTGCRFPGAEISRNISVAKACRRFPSLRGLGLVQSGDAHRLDEMINTTRLKVCDLNVKELRLALLGQEGRRIEITSSQDPS